MGKSVRKQHPRDRGLVLMTAWVDPALREYARTRATEAGMPVSEWIARAIQRQVSATALGKFCFTDAPFGTSDGEAREDARVRAEAVDVMKRTGSPGPRFCACGRRTTECDGSRKACASSDGGTP